MKDVHVYVRIVKPKITHDSQCYIKMNITFCDMFTINDKTLGKRSGNWIYKTMKQ